MFLFRKKGKKREYIPVDIVQNLSSKGMSEQEIVAVLRRQGFSPYQIERAISTALKSAVNELSQKSTREFKPPEKIVPGEMIKERVEPVKLSAPPKTPFEAYPPREEKRVPEFYTLPPQQQGQSFPELPPKEEKNEQEFTFQESQDKVFEKPPMPGPREELPEITLEEIIEGIVAEKWSHFEEVVGELRKADEELRKKIEKLENEILEINKNMKKREETFINKLEEHGEHVATIEARIGSIEKVFKDFLPELTENIKLLKETIEKERKI